MRKHLILILLFSFDLCHAQSIIQKQTYIPFDNAKGIPFGEGEMGDEKIDGFNIDKNENYYFINCANHLTTLVAFSGNRLLYRRQYHDIYGLLHIYADKLYVFQHTSPKQLYSFDISSGSLIKRQILNTKGSINSYRFVDSLLIVDVLGDDTSFTLNHFAYNLLGEKKGKINNAYFLPVAFNNISHSAQFLGIWNNYYLFWDYDTANSSNDKYWIANQSGKIINQTTFSNKLLGHNFSNPEVYRKYLNGFIYVLGYKDKIGIISKLSVEELFK